jgi:hypothetical protein
MAEDDAIVVDLDDIHHEALANMWSFSPDDDAASDLRPEDVAHFVGQVLEARRRLVAEGHAAMLFYCWHDAQTRQLRFSLVSAAHGRLPFRIALQHEATPWQLRSASSMATGATRSGARLPTRTWRTTRCPACRCLWHSCPEPPPGVRAGLNPGAGHTAVY